MLPPRGGWGEIQAPRGAGAPPPPRPPPGGGAARPPRRSAPHLGRHTSRPGGAAACNDLEDIAPWADDSRYWATAVGLLEWSEGGRLAPQEYVSADELERTLSRFFDRPVPAVPYLLEHWQP